MNVDASRCTWYNCSGRNATLGLTMFLEVDLVAPAHLSQTAVMSHMSKVA